MIARLLVSAWVAFGWLGLSLAFASPDPELRGIFGLLGHEPSARARISVFFVALAGATIAGPLLLAGVLLERSHRERP
jgi:hypothetical protein